MSKPAPPHEWSGQYSPLEVSPPLFDTFLTLTPDDKDALLCFANQFGCLGLHANSTMPETWSSWRREILALRLTNAIRLKLDDLVKPNRTQNERFKDEHKLERLIRYRGKLRHFRTSKYRQVPPPLPPIYGHWQKLLGRSELVDAAVQLFGELVNQRLALYTAPQVRLRVDREIADQTWLDVEITPANLLGALWLQFALADHLALQPPRRCRQCGRVLDEQTGRGRKSAYCHNACKTAYHRRKRKWGESGVGPD